MATLLSDAFTRANSALSPGSPTTGGPYTVVTGVAGISSNQLYFPTTSTSNVGSHLTFPGAADVDLQMTLAVQGGNSNPAGLMFRYIDANNWWSWESSGSQFRLVHCLANVQNTWAIGPAAVSGDVLRVVAYKRQLTCFANGQILLVADDPYADTATTVCGLRIHNANHRIDDVSAVDASQFASTGFLYKGRDTKVYDVAGVA